MKKSTVLEDPLQWEQVELFGKGRKWVNNHCKYHTFLLLVIVHILHERKHFFPIRTIKSCFTVYNKTWAAVWIACLGFVCSYSIINWNLIFVLLLNNGHFSMAKQVGMHNFSCLNSVRSHDMIMFFFTIQTG